MEEEMKELALKEVNAFRRRYNDLKTDIAHQAKIVVFTLGEPMQNNEHVLRVEISPNNGKTFITSSEFHVGGFLCYDKETESLEVGELSNNMNEIEIIDYYNFDCVDIDIQINILKEIIENYL